MARRATLNTPPTTAPNLLFVLLFLSVPQKARTVTRAKIANIMIHHHLFRYLR